MSFPDVLMMSNIVVGSRAISAEAKKYQYWLNKCSWHAPRLCRKTM